MMRRTWLAVVPLVAIATLGAGPVKAVKPVKSARLVEALPLQVALDRAGFSVGEIDGHFGAKTRKALRVFRQTHGLSGSAAPDAATWAALADPRTQRTPPATTFYIVTEADAQGPFLEKIPRDPAEQGTLPALAYTSIGEMLAERFHASPALLRRLNASAKRPLAAGVRLAVPNVDPLVPPQGSGRRRDAETATDGVPQAVEVVVSQNTNDLIALDAKGAVIFYAPVSSGSEHDPLPIGDWTVRGVYLNPRFFYNPDLFWDADSSNTKTRIAAGPNNPVGLVWIDLDRPHYGLHGTPEPSMVGVTQSHGCVRLTNWDAVRLAAMVREGTRVSFRPTLPELSSGAAAHAQTASAPAAAAGPAAVVPAPAAAAKETGPAAAADGDDDPNVRELQARRLTIPVNGVRADQLVDSFRDARSGHAHEALDIMASRGTPVIAVEDGTIVKLFLSKPGGNTIYQFDPSRRFAYYYAHLDRYASGLKEGQTVRRGDTIGYVGSTGNADAKNPHLHFGIFLLTPEHQWWKGTAIDPYPVLRAIPEGSGQKLSRRR
jgi:lipoprotein-anchoring transpeptidase ErfK/SrfK